MQILEGEGNTAAARRMPKRGREAAGRPGGGGAGGGGPSAVTSKKMGKGKRQKSKKAKGKTFQVLAACLREARAHTPRVLLARRLCAVG